MVRAARAISGLGQDRIVIGSDRIGHGTARLVRRLHREPGIILAENEVGRAARGPEGRRDGGEDEERL